MNTYTNPSIYSEKVWGFDVGKGSLGEAVREGLDFKHIQSIIIDSEFAETKTAAAARRQMRTRLAHKAREAFLEDALKSCDIEVLKRRAVDFIDGKWQLSQLGDVRLEKEFPAEGEDICYNSIALRCKLLLGEKLESWQVFKALNSAIQNRGYDENIPWKETEMNDSKKESDDYAKKLKVFEKELSELIAPIDNWQKYNYPCFFKASKMGLWSPENPNEVGLRIDHTAAKAKGYVIPREYVEKELKALIDMASLQFPKLKGKALYIMYGNAETPYASYNAQLRKKFGLKRGAQTDWTSLGQKIPRFDNRIIDKCALIPRFNVCRIKKIADARDESDLLFYDIVLAMKLLNLRLFKGTKIVSLTFDEFKSAFELGKSKGYKLGVRDLKKFLKSINASELDENNNKIEEPKAGGRASFCKPAMALLKELIFSGKAPSEFYKEKLHTITNADKNKGIVSEDLDFIKLMGDCTWGEIFIPDVKAHKYLASLDESSENQINKLIGEQNDPIVRHRLSFFYERIKILEKKFGVPDKIILEFVRDDFLGKEAKNRLQKAINQRFAEKLRIAKKLDELSAGTKDSAGDKTNYKSSKMLTKLELFQLQNSECIYTGEPLLETDLPSLEIEHIVPRSRGGPDSIYNYVLTTEKTNKEKGDRTPYEWLSSNAEKWEAYSRRVKTLSQKLGKKRTELLLREDAETLVEKYTALAETAWIAKLAQRIICMHFGFQFGGTSGNKRVFTVSGNTTARIRASYGLNKILHNTNLNNEQLSVEEKIKLQSELEKKNRKNKKHHALDAMCLCFAPTSKNLNLTNGRDLLPREIAKDAISYFSKYLNAIVPNEVAVKKARLEDGIYSTRVIKGKKRIVRKFDIVGLAYKAGLKPTYDLDSLTKNIDSILNPVVRKIIAKFAQTNPTEDEWVQWCANVKIPSSDGKGTRIIRTLLDIGNPDEYKDLSKDSCGAYRKGDNHKGQIIWKSTKGKYYVAPIYVYASRIRLIEELKQNPNFSGIEGEFRKHCLVELPNDADNGIGNHISAGIYMLNTIESAGRTKLTDSNGNLIKPINIAYLMKAGMKRIFLEY